MSSRPFSRQLLVCIDFEREGFAFGSMAPIIEIHEALEKSRTTVDAETLEQEPRNAEA